MSIFPDHDEKINILDLGCGTGCIAITILTLYKNITTTLADISINALKIAQKNAEKHNVRDRCKFVISDWFQNINDQYDVVLSNPPYISKNERLSDDTLYDPSIALFAQDNGLAAYKNIIANCNSKYLLLEIGANQLKTISKFLCDFNIINVIKDLAGIDRIVVLKKHDGV